jgi:hypothetical protein
MEKGEVFKKTYTPTFLSLIFPKGEISQQKLGGPHKERVSAHSYFMGRTASIQSKCFGLQERHLTFLLTFLLTESLESVEGGFYRKSCDSASRRAGVHDEWA